ncbi:MAG: CapA family protein [Coriobacteriia bacterium]|nr:CapA family protein [Coriobacteriia bacterium]
MRDLSTSPNGNDGDRNRRRGTRRVDAGASRPLHQAANQDPRRHRSQPARQDQRRAAQRAQHAQPQPQGNRRRSTPMPQIPDAAQQRSAARRSAVARRKPTGRLSAIIPAFIAMAVVAVLAVGGLTASCNAPADQTAADASAETETAQVVQPTSVHFVAVGDNLPEEQIGAWADAQAGTTGDGLYDYTTLYAPIKSYIESADLAYVKEETHCGGDDIGPKGYPSFNTTDAMADAIVSTGFDLVASASNHSYDWGYFGANDHSCELWKTKDVVFAGTADCADDAAKIATIEKNGITFALLDYTYGVNGYEQSDLPSYAVNFIDKDRIASDVAAAKQQADVVLVAMHWGTENLMEADETQLEYAQYLADLGVDVVLGSHPHVIGPMRWVEGKDGNQTLVAYSLGNFVSRHEAPSPKNELEGMLSCDFVRAEDGTVSVQNVVWTPLVNHTDGETFAVYALKDYTNELAAQDSVFSELDDPCAWLKQTSEDVVGGGFDIDA